MQIMDGFLMSKQGYVMIVSISIHVIRIREWCQLPVVRDAQGVIFLKKWLTVEILSHQHLNDVGGY